MAVLTFSVARDRLLRLWFFGLIIPVVIALVQTYFNHYAEKGASYKEIILGIAWLYNLIVPISSILIGTIKGSRDPQGDKELINLRCYNAALIGLCVYIAILSLSLAVQGLVAWDIKVWFAASSATALAVQGVISSLLVKAFVRSF